MNFKDLFYLDHAYSPKIMLWAYWITLVVTVFSGLASMFDGGMLTFASFIRGLFVIGFGFIMLRVVVEAIQALFKIEKHLRAISESMTEKAQSTED
ncbi:Uncharacterised protein [BD1-7 clade bacterium]|uniref:DUF4282 domain-containing protein n=1 Tax=BD1-7 clade bacterium TaxID=2029982 RepID=A0A5S9N6F0_9GAMM|nr:Uncharacterised protein [BD1-7 clade bacterium]CAA0094611.1 Uncharacterised protein [BD1-7 clade bacterium]CAA0095367.1 Uncharacterised protein [BD1-7 clade bacterium]